MTFFLDEARRTFFGKTPVVIESAFPLEETQARIRLVLSRRFFSRHMKHTVKGQFDGRRFEMAHGSNHYSEFDTLRKGVHARSMPIVMPRLVGEIIEEEGRVKIDAVLESSMPDRINAVLLLGFPIFLIALLPMVGLDGSYGTVLFVGTLASALLLRMLLHSLRFRGERLGEMLNYVLIEVESRAELQP